ncbi:MAG: RnfABCDGE type electron transport complex subunit D [Treponema sp.]|jgi:electron transport complex protein RnfD|nr:RnfABCDGE type electron transport complex subunit D [Treponema sp.]
MNNQSLLLSSSPHIASPVNSAQLMRNVLIALAPVSLFGIIIFGLMALINIVVSIGAAVGAEVFFRFATKQDVRVKDLSAVVSGLLLALVLPPGIPFWMTALGAIFAVVVAKEFFGGLGANVFNPALTGRAFLLMSFPVAMTTWNKPTNMAGFASSLMDAVTTATPLGAMKMGADMGATVNGDVVMDGVSEALLAADLPNNWGDLVMTLFWGNHGGCIGETSILLILVGAIFLLVTKTIDWRAPVGMLGAVVVMSLCLGLDPIIGVLGGGVLFGAVFMATDYTTAPVTAKGKLVFGVGAGIIIVLIRKWGAFPEGVTYGLLIMNAVTPFLNRLLSRKYGFVKNREGSK